MSTSNTENRKAKSKNSVNAALAERVFFFRPVAEWALEKSEKTIHQEVSHWTSGKLVCELTICFDLCIFYQR
jgi:hypothetical protein